MKAWVLLAAAGLLSGVPASHGTPLQCRAGMRKALAEGHFDTPIICSPANARFVLAGRTSRGAYDIYDYRYRFLPHPGGVMHGDERIVVFQRGRYIGQYSVMAGPLSSVTVHGTKVIVTSGEERTRDVVDFSKGPPKEAFFAGNMQSFYR